MKSTAKPFAVVDLFSGPGGLAEGFAACREPRGRARYRVALSVEKDRDAHRTLLLRAFLRKFEAGFPREYYEFLNGGALESEEPDWKALYPGQWAQAMHETLLLELGTPDADRVLRQRVRKIRKEHGGNTVLLGGPPCQAYSVVGRARNRGKPGYDPSEDKRYTLYKQYRDVLWQLRPAVAVMENVKGILSARVNGSPILPSVLAALRHRGREIDGYCLYGLGSESGAHRIDWDDDVGDFVVRCEERGVPQARHRVFVVCVRADVAAALEAGGFPSLETQSRAATVDDVVGGMPALRSRLSREDSPAAWRKAVLHACTLVECARPATLSAGQRTEFESALSSLREAMERDLPPTGKAAGRAALSATCPADLRRWLSNSRVRVLPNNETRGHMPADLARYLFAAAYASALGRSPNTRDFPEALAADHRNWSTGSFSDRYRVQLWDRPSTTVTSHLSKDGHSFIHPDFSQVRSLTVREAARLQTFPDDYLFKGSRTSQYIQVGNAVPPFLAYQIAGVLGKVLDAYRECAVSRRRSETQTRRGHSRGMRGRQLPLVASEGV